MKTARGAERHSENDFRRCFEELQGSILGACASHGEWEAKVSVGIQAVLEFAAERPGAASTLMGGDRSDGAGEPAEAQVVSFFTRLLREVTPRRGRLPIPSDEAVVNSIGTVVRGHLLTGKAEKLPALAPELVLLALVPYSGLAAARAWAERVQTLR